MANEFETALQKARFELTQVEAEQKRLAQRKAELLQAITGLAALVTEQPTREASSLADAIRTVIGGYEMNKPGTVFTAKLVRSLLQEMGFDFEGYNANHLAIIHNAMRRMRQAGELKLAGDLDFGGGYKLVRSPIEQLADGAKFRTPRKTLGQRIAEETTEDKLGAPESIDNAVVRGYKAKD